MKGWKALTKPGTKEELVFAYDQIRRNPSKDMPTACTWMLAKGGLFKVGISKEEWSAIDKKWREIEKRRAKEEPLPHASKYERKAR